MFPVNDLLDAILLGGFLFGVLFTIASLLLGFADVGHGSDSGGNVGGDLISGLFNLTAILAFITWFGGIGYLFRNVAGWNSFFSVVLGLGGGLIAAFAVSWFVIKVLRPGGKELDPHDYDTVGVMAKVTSGIREGGFGEIVYELGGTRQVASAKASTLQSIAFGTEVVVLRVEKGVAVVEPFADLLADELA